mmetsp:Transcript_32842/g.72307  ORF Transcript_32842/g.72307 Transcript_32842/m.72307 type:complete len:233 (+) Transcript_32842:438-1136(+)
MGGTYEGASIFLKSANSDTSSASLLGSVSLSRYSAPEAADMIKPSSYCWILAFKSSRVLMPSCSLTSRSIFSTLLIMSCRTGADTKARQPVLLLGGVGPELLLPLEAGAAGAAVGAAAAGTAASLEVAVAVSTAGPVALPPSAPGTASTVAAVTAAVAVVMAEASAPPTAVAPLATLVSVSVSAPFTSPLTPAVASAAAPSPPLLALAGVLSHSGCSLSSLATLWGSVFTSR